MGSDDDSLYSDRYVEALEYAAVMHRAQTRKGGRVPYLTHLMALSSLVWEHGGDEDQAIAGLLHDTVEDCGGPPILVEVRKTRHLAKLAHIGAHTALVIACDKLHNLSSTAAEYQREGEAVFAKFNPDADARWYYRRMRDTLAPRLPTGLLGEIDRNLTLLDA